MAFDLDETWRRLAQSCAPFPAASETAERWLVRLGKGSCGLRHEVGARFAWITGSRDDVVASVPDAAFEGAVKMAIERDDAAPEEDSRVGT